MSKARNSKRKRLKLVKPVPNNLNGQNGVIVPWEEYPIDMYDRETKQPKPPKQHEPSKETRRKA